MLASAGGQHANEAFLTRGSVMPGYPRQVISPTGISLPRLFIGRAAHRFCGGDDFASVLAHKLALAQVPRAAQAPAPVACGGGLREAQRGFREVSLGPRPSASVLKAVVARLHKRANDAEYRRCPPSTATRAFIRWLYKMRGLLWWEGACAWHDAST